VLPAEINRRGFTKALFVTDKELIKYGVAQKVITTGHANNQQRHHQWYDGHAHGIDPRRAHHVQGGQHATRERRRRWLLREQHAQRKAQHEPQRDL
jgi:hypothetical protein